MSDFVDQHKVINISIAIILFIMAFITPAAIIYPIKMGYITRDAIEIGTTPWAILTGGVGITAFAFIFLFFGILEKMKIKFILTAALLGIGVLGIALSIKDYYYITPTHFASNGPFSFETIFFEWKDFESVEERLGNEGGTILVESVILEMKDGTQLKYSGDPIIRMSKFIIHRVEEAGGKHIRTELPK